MKDKYFKVIVVSDYDISGIKIFDKKTNKLIQQIPLDCDFRGSNSINIDDYNFDGIDDFSILEHMGSGANYSLIYFLYDSKTKKYFKSDFIGAPLSFDKKRKQIYYHYASTDETFIHSAEYKVVNNKMVLISEICEEYIAKKNTYKKIKCK